RIGDNVDFDLFEPFEQSCLECEEELLIFLGVLYVNYQTRRFILVADALMEPSASHSCRQARDCAEPLDQFLAGLGMYLRTDRPAVVVRERQDYLVASFPHSQSPPGPVRSKLPPVPGVSRGLAPEPCRLDQRNSRCDLPAPFP